MFLFLRAFNFNFILSFHSLRNVISRFSLLIWRIFFSQISTQCPDCKFSLPVLGFLILFFFCYVFGKQFNVIHVHFVIPVTSFTDDTEPTKWDHCHFHIPCFFFRSLARSSFLSFFSLSFSLTLLYPTTFLLSACISKFQRSLCIPFFRMIACCA